MIIVADAAPLIFLAKLNRLPLIIQTFGNDIFIPSPVAEEILCPPLPPNEELLLQRFLDSVTIVKIAKSRKKSMALSPADLAVHKLAAERKANYVLTDDKLLRSLLQSDGLVPMGTIGILMQAQNKGLLSKNEVRHLIDDLIKKHKLRIGIALYERILEHLEQ